MNETSSFRFYERLSEANFNPFSVPFQIRFHAKTYPKSALFWGLGILPNSLHDSNLARRNRQKKPPSYKLLHKLFTHRSDSDTQHRTVVQRYGNAVAGNVRCFGAKNLSISTIALAYRHRRHTADDIIYSIRAALVEAAVVTSTA